MGPDPNDQEKFIICVGGETLSRMYNDGETTCGRFVVNCGVTTYHELVMSKDGVTVGSSYENEQEAAANTSTNLGILRLRYEDGRVEASIICTPIDVEGDDIPF